MAKEIIFVRLKGIAMSHSTIKLATPLSVVHVPTWRNTDPPRDYSSLPSEYIPFRIYSTKYIHGKVVEAGLKLPDRAFSVLPARSLFSTWRPQHPRFTTFLLFHLSLFSLFSLSFFTCFDLLVNSNLVCTRRM